jgi:CubicO group peptidase (beta-lactamase class C family)
VNLKGNQASIREACDAGLLAGAVTVVWQHGKELQVNEIGYRDIVLVEDLLTHTSGLAYGFSVTGPVSREYVRLPFGQGPDVWLTELAALPLVHQPGQRLTYSHAIDVLGVLISRIEGEPVYQVLDERILQPLGMTDTGFFVSVEGRRRTATMYRLDDNDQLQHDVMGQPHISPPAFCSAGGGLWSTADDYLRLSKCCCAMGH